MRIGFVVALLHLALAASAFSQGSPPDAMWPETNHDFGTVPRGAQLLHRLPWRNTGNHRLEIVDLRSSCGCLTVTPQPRALEPGQSGHLEVQMDARRFAGPKTVFIQLLVNPGPIAKTIQVQANSRQDLVYNPGQLAFGVLPAGVAGTQTLNIEYAGNLNWRIEGIASAPEHLDVQFAEIYRRPGQVGYRISATLKDTAPAGDFKHEIQLKTNDPAEPVIAVVAEATLRPAISVTPNPVNFGSTRVGKMVSRRVILRSEKPFQITKLEGGEAVAPVFSPSTNSVQAITLQWTPTSPGEMSQEITIGTDQPSSPVLKLVLTGSAR